jgi:hypothetical protein
MARIEWTRRDGDDVEAVVAMFVNRERPNSTRITPSRGDGGVDIVDRGAASDGRDEVNSPPATRTSSTITSTEVAASLRRPTRASSPCSVLKTLKRPPAFPRSQPGLKTPSACSTTTRITVTKFDLAKVNFRRHPCGRDWS